jgi:hypothetical protein
MSDLFNRKYQDIHFQTNSIINWIRLATCSFQHFSLDKSFLFFLLFIDMTYFYLDRTCCLFSMWTRIKIIFLKELFNFRFMVVNSNHYFRYSDISKMQIYLPPVFWACCNQWTNTFFVLIWNGLVRISNQHNVSRWNSVQTELSFKIVCLFLSFPFFLKVD